jgi:hypothetical protein
MALRTRNRARGKMGGAPAKDELLKEDGSFLLLEDGSRILLETN